MNAPIAIRQPQAAAILYDKKQLDLIWRTVAKDCTADEFSVFVETCRALQLNPLRRQVYAFVYNKGDPDKRQLTIVTAISGFRAVAARTGNYRPGDTTWTINQARTERDQEIAKARRIEDLAERAKRLALIDQLYPIDPANPEGIEKATVSVWQFSHCEWHEHKADAFWSEFAPVKEEAEDYDYVDTGEVWPDTGKPKKKKVARGTVERRLDPKTQWPKMPRLMIAKCAEALALRQAWPDDFANVYEESEVDKAKMLDLTASELADLGATESRMEKAGVGLGLLMTFDDLGTLVDVPYGKVFDRCDEHMAKLKDEPSALALWWDRNRVPLREFWARDKSAALALKETFERYSAEVQTGVKDAQDDNGGDA
ncbi:phage recombination protein Bet [Alsobacter metallidurans]|uniref:Phage recombination protein Bet n=1 Tax=Alsobacter metallidurans TaxID=340221 RepID=A0A917I4Q7_9HYPH|nr:phage recombination protein Bet [Alsobacter metallidurans]GGH14526.1 phage recombination protein Bet [Alsobacter metallidurans]